MLPESLGDMSVATELVSRGARTDTRGQVTTDP